MKKYLSDAEVAVLSQKIHRGQTTADGGPYYLHPEAVSEIAVGFARDALKSGACDLLLRDFSPAEIISITFQASRLHDTFEDQPRRANPEKFLRLGVHPEVVKRVTMLTRTEGMPYGEEILHISQDVIATFCKRGDLCHNSRAERVATLLPSRDISRVLAAQQKYLLSYLFLSGALPREQYVEFAKSF